MRVKFEYKHKKFEWDHEKVSRVLAERGIDFRDAAIALVDGQALIASSPRNGEERHVGLVEIHGQVWAVVHTWRGETLRIITVRRARIREERAYRDVFAERVEASEKSD